jgi:lambda family phage tail tape measure protein
MSIATGKASEDLQVMAEIAAKTGGNVDSLAASLDKLAVKMAKGDDDPEGKFGKALAYFGVSLTDVNGKMKSQEEVAHEVAVAYEHTTESASKHAAAMEVLGKSYRENLPSLLALDTAEEEHNKLMETGAMKSKELMEASKAYNDSTRDLHKTTEGIGNTIAGMFLPLMTSVSEALYSSATNEGLLQYALEILGMTLEVVGVALKGIVSVFIEMDLGFQVLSKTIGVTLDLLNDLIHWDSSKASAAWTKYVDDITKSAVNANKSISDLWKTIDTKSPGKKPEGATDRGDYNPNKDKKPPKIKIPKKSQYEKDLDTMNAYIARLEDEAAAIGKTNDQIAERNLNLAAEKLKTKELSDEMKVHGQSLLDEISLRNKIEAAKKNNLEFDKEYAKQEKEFAKETHDLLAEQYSKLQALIQNTSEVKAKVYSDSLAILDKALKDEMISVKQYKEAVDELNDKAAETTNRTEQQMNKIFDKMRSGLADLVVSGKGSFKELVSGILSEIANMLANQAFLEFFNYLGITKNGSFSAGSGGSLISSIGSSLTSSGSGFGDMISKAATYFGFADGGIVNQPTIIGTHNDGLAVAGEAGPEAVIPLKNGSVPVQMTGGKSGPTMNFNINVTSDSTEDAAKKARVIADQVKSIVLQTLNNERRPGNSLNPTSAF